MLHDTEVPALPEVGVKEQLLAVEHRCRLHAGALKKVEGLVVVLLTRPALDEIVERIVVLVAGEDVGEAFVLGPLGMAGRAAEGRPLLVVLDGDDEPVVVAPAPVAPVRGSVKEMPLRMGGPSRYPVPADIPDAGSSPIP
jgi:hypothetical protein